jgi:hypothetical protein
MSLEPQPVSEAENAVPFRTPAEVSTQAAPEPTVRVTRYEVSCLPQNNVNADLFTLSVEERSPGRWAVLRGGMCYDADGVREFESMSTGRTDEFIARFRFDLDTALELAKRIAPTMKVNRHTVADALTDADA